MRCSVARGPCSCTSDRPGAASRSSGGELMRGILVALAFAVATVTAVPTKAAVHSASTPTIVASSNYYLQEAPTKNLDVDINVNHGGGRWYRSPTFVAI